MSKKKNMNSAAVVSQSNINVNPFSIDRLAMFWYVLYVNILFILLVKETYQLSAFRLHLHCPPISFQYSNAFGILGLPLSEAYVL